MAGKKASTQKKENYTLVIVESPAKAKTIEKFLGKGYKVAASNGHLIDLPKSRIGVDIEANYEPDYIVIRGKTQLLNALKKEAAAAKKVYLATDPDREGEAISWHIAHALGIKESDPCRIEFHEITKNAVLQAAKNPRNIDENRVNAQQARRVLDRLVGYKLSPLLWNKVRRGLSAGRVQTAAVKMIVDREREIRAFQPQEYWTISAILSDEEKKQQFEAKYFGKNGKKFEPKSKEEADQVVQEIRTAEKRISDIKKSGKKRRPAAPFTTSTLQQDASRKLGFTARRTMAVAQGLYEGVSLSASMQVGLITYMRTDSTRISAEAQAAAKACILERFGERYVPETYNQYAARKNAQDAHEAIRPTNLSYTPESIREKLSTEQYKLYKLIYHRFLASQMTPAEYETMTYEIKAGEHSLRAYFSKQVFNGYLAVYDEKVEEEEGVNQVFPEMRVGDVCLLLSITPKQNFTAPPPRYTEASLIKMMEEQGIGRPSTYAPILSTIQERQYVEKEKKNLVPTDLGEMVTKLMEQSFPDIADIQFTAAMEEKLDDVENKGKDWKHLIDDFYQPFSKELEKAEVEMEKVKIPDRPSGIICEKCGAEMVYKSGRFGEFIACPNYPTCKNTKAIKKTIEAPCPKCGGEVAVKRSKKGRIFYGCSNYPDCDFVSWDQPLKDHCPTCGAYMVEKNGKGEKAYKKCSNPECPTNQKRKQEEAN